MIHGIPKTILAILVLFLAAGALAPAVGQEHEDEMEALLEQFKDHFDESELYESTTKNPVSREDPKRTPSRDADAVVSPQPSPDDSDPPREPRPTRHDKPDSPCD